jgi:hypothetical protein
MESSASAAISTRDERDGVDGRGTTMAPVRVNAATMPPVASRDAMGSAVACRSARKTACSS